MRCIRRLAPLIYCSLTALFIVGCDGGEDGSPAGPRPPPEPDSPTPRLGTIVVSVRTTGSPVDPTGYCVELDRSRKRTLWEANYSRPFIRVDVGRHELLLTGIADNCAVVGSNPQYATVTAGDTTYVNFEVFCSSPDTPPST